LAAWLKQRPFAEEWKQQSYPDDGFRVEFSALSRGGNRDVGRNQEQDRPIDQLHAGERQPRVSCGGDADEDAVISKAAPRIYF